MELGIRNGEQVEIVAGLKAGDRVISDGRFNVYDGALVTIASAAEVGN